MTTPPYLAARAAMANSTTTLYRMFDTKGRLLYVGISKSPFERLGQHRAGKEWWTEIASVTMTHYPARPDALEAEAAAITAECPIYNRAGAAGGSIPGPDEIREMPLASTRARAVRAYFDAEAEMRRLRVEVIRELLAEGASKEEAAEEVGVSVATVKAVLR